MEEELRLQIRERELAQIEKELERLRAEEAELNKRLEDLWTR